MLPVQLAHVSLHSQLVDPQLPFLSDCGLLTSRLVVYVLLSLVLAVICCSSGTRSSAVPPALVLAFSWSVVRSFPFATACAEVDSRQILDLSFWGDFWDGGGKREKSEHVWMENCVGKLSIATLTLSRLSAAR